jgi:hypothetical protein
MKLLEALLVQHPELGLAAELEYCQQAVGVASERCQTLKPVVQRGFRKQLFLLRTRLASWWWRWWA